jgi:hypothetical protein
MTNSRSLTRPQGRYPKKNKGMMPQGNEHKRPIHQRAHLCPQPQEYDEQEGKWKNIADVDSILIRSTAFTQSVMCKKETA